MKSIERNFTKTVEKHPEWSSFICFSNTIMGAGFSEPRIKIMFDKLVDKNDYAKSEKKELIKFLLSINKPLNRIENRGLFDSGRDEKEKEV